MYHNELLREYHEIYKIIKAISQSYYFLYMQEKVTKYVSKCNLYHKIKLSRYRSYEEMRQISTSDQF